MSKRFTMLLGGGLILLLTFTQVGKAAAQTCVQPPTGLVSWWPGDGNANDIIDDNHGTLQNGTTFATGMVGQAFSFDGVDDFVEIADAVNLHLESGDLTIEMWGKLTGPDTQQYDLIDKMFSPTDDITSGYLVHTLTATTGGEGVLRFCFAHTDIGGRRCYDAHRNIVDGQFHHIAIVKSGLDVKIYVDGQDDFAAFNHSVDSSVAAPVSMLIGKRHDNTDFFQGMIDEVSIYNRALSATEIQDIFNAASAGKCQRGAFASFAAVATFALGPQEDDDAFAVQATFTLGNDSTGIAPLTDPVHLQVGTLSLTIPAGSFQRAAHHGAFVFEGVIDGVHVRSTVLPPKGNGKKSQTYQFKASGTGANLSGTEIPVHVRLVVGDDGGSTTLTEVTAQSPQ